MTAINSDSIKWLARELKILIDDQDAYQKAKDEYCGYEWYNDGNERTLRDDVEYQAEIIAEAFDTMIENKVKEILR